MAQNRHWEQDKDATVYIGNIDERATPAMVYEIMLQMGPIHNIHMPRDRVTQSHQGFGFVEFRTPADAEYAANVINGVKLYGKSLRVNKASADKQRSSDIGAELFIGNLDPSVDERILYDTFSRFGSLLSLPKVARDDLGASKGFGFVSFGDFESSDAAVMNLHGQYIHSKEVSVQYAFKKDGKGERHGDNAERELAAQARKRNLVPDAQPVPQGFLGGPPPQQQHQPPPQQQLPPPQQHQQPPPAGPAGFDHPSAGGLNGGMPVGMPPQGPPPGFGAPPPRGPSPYNHGHAPPPVMGRGSTPLPPAPSGLPARPPQGHPGGFPNPADFHPGHPGHPGHGSFRPSSGSPANIGFPVGGPPPPPGFGVPPGPNGAPGPPPPGFAPPPGFQPPPGFARR